MRRATAEEFEAAINERMSAIFYFYNISRMKGQVPLEDGIAIARRHGIPLIVDAAAQLPPVENLWRFTEMGADLAIFSGGKGLCGPQSSGLVVGRKALIDAIAFHANPRIALGRPMKVGKEEIVGLLATVKRYLTLDHAAIMRDLGKAGSHGHCRVRRHAACDRPPGFPQRSRPAHAPRQSHLRRSRPRPHT